MPLKFSALLSPPLRSTQRRGAPRALLLLLAVGVLLIAQTTKAEPTSPKEYDVKAAFLLNFAQFVTWPESRSREKPITFGILGEDPFGPAFDLTMEGRTINDLPIQVKRFRRDEPPVGVDVLFICLSEAPFVDKILAELKSRPTLTVSDMEHFTQHGGMIGLVLREGRIRFQINHQAGAAAGLVFSSKLLRLAEPSS